jgi:hypothetical protein
VGENSKISPWPLIKAQHKTYVNATNNRPRAVDYLLFDGTPCVVLAVCLSTGVKLSTGASSALLTASLLLSALLFGVMLQVSQRAIDWADDPAPASRETTEHTLFLREIGTNAAYASLVCVVASIAFVVSTMTSGLALEISSAVGLALGAHLFLVLLMVMKRLFMLTNERLNQVVSGEAHDKVFPHRRRAAGGGRR